MVRSRAPARYAQPQQPTPTVTNYFSFTYFLPFIVGALVGGLMLHSLAVVSNELPAPIGESKPAPNVSQQLLRAPAPSQFMTALAAYAKPSPPPPKTAAPLPATAAGPLVRLSHDTTFPSAALIVIFSESRRSLLKSLPNWAANAWWMTRYELVILYAAGKADPADLAAFARLAPLWKITLIPFTYDPMWQTEAFKGGGGGGPYISWLLAHEIYFSIDALRRFDYFMRMDDDITYYRPSVGDPFLELATSGARIGWKQLIPDNDAALRAPLFARALEFGKKFAGLSDVWPLVTVHENRGPNTISDWRPFLVAGCVEIYHASVFRVPAYQAYLAAVGAAELLKKRAVWEQEVKTMWMQLSVPKAEWKCIACLLPMTHKEEVRCCLRGV